MTYSQVVTAASEATWLSRVKAALFEASIAIAEDTPSAGLNVRRDKLARKIIFGQMAQSFFDNYALACGLGFLSGNDLNAGTVSDAQLAGRVSAVFNDFIEPYSQ